LTAPPWLRWAALAAGIAVVAHVATVWLLPRFAMVAAIATFASPEGYNHAVFPPRADDTARAIVRPSPDLLYAGCAFDLSAGPVRIRAQVPRETYWSLSMFAASTDNFFVVNDRDGGGAPVDLVLARTGADVRVPAGARLVESPSERGIVLTRTVVASAAREAELDEARRLFTCAPLG
jgi:uncharacterized membrane protein